MLLNILLSSPVWYNYDLNAILSITAKFVFLWPITIINSWLSLSVACVSKSAILIINCRKTLKQIRHTSTKDLKMLSTKLISLVARRNPQLLLNRGFRHETWVSGPPRVRISLPEKIAHGLVISGCFIATPMWILYHLKSYKPVD